MPYPRRGCSRQRATAIASKAKIKNSQSKDCANIVCNIKLSLPSKSLQTNHYLVANIAMATGKLPFSIIFLSFKEPFVTKSSVFDKAESFLPLKA